MRKMRDGERVLIPCFVGRLPSGGLRRARAYKVGGYWRAFPTTVGMLLSPSQREKWLRHVNAWWLTSAGPTNLRNPPLGEGDLWCRGWSGPSARALRAAMALR